MIIASDHEDEEQLSIWHLVGGWMARHSIVQDGWFMTMLMPMLGDKTGKPVAVDGLKLNGRRDKF